MSNLKGNIFYDEFIKVCVDFTNKEKSNYDNQLSSSAAFQRGYLMAAVFYNMQMNKIITIKESNTAFNLVYMSDEHIRHEAKQK